jgi:hypothetical protein
LTKQAKATNRARRAMERDTFKANLLKNFENTRIVYFLLYFYYVVKGVEAYEKYEQPPCVAWPTGSVDLGVGKPSI